MITVVAAHLILMTNNIAAEKTRDLKLETSRDWILWGGYEFPENFDIV